SVKGANPAAPSVSANTGLSETETNQVLQATAQIAGEILSGQSTDIAKTLDGFSDEQKQAVLMLLQGLLSQIVSGGENVDTGSSSQASEQGVFNSVFSQIFTDEESSSSEKSADVLAVNLTSEDDSKTSKDILEALALMLVQIFAGTSETSTASANENLQSGNENAVLKIGEVEIPLALSQSQCEELLQGAIEEIKAEIYPQINAKGQSEAIQNSAVNAVLTENAENSSNGAANASFPTGAKGDVVKSDPKVAFYTQNVLYSEKSENTQTSEVKDSSSLKLISEGNTAKTVAAQKITDKKDELEEIGIKSEAAKFAVPLEKSDIQTEETIKPEDIKNFDASQIAEKAKAQITTLKSGEKAEMTMTLSPESLGEITLKLQNDGGKVSVLIAAHSEATQKLLQERLPDLVSSLKAVNSGVEDVKVVNTQEAQYAGLGFGNSGFGGTFGDNRPSRNEQAYYGSVTAADTSSEEKDETEFRGGSRLWQTA
ncbi:MAG: flagellar hook-length control protein FliK, partial [Oscillospiraceae bacterium]|nr:flagellar hook-length control protein FliK [Oscillospiraceae bacterium]